MKPFLASLLGRRFWIPAYLTIAIGLFLPGHYDGLAPLVPVTLGGILFFSCLKLPLADIAQAVGERRRWQQVGAMSATKLLLVPALAFTVTWCFAPEWAPGVALVCAMPAGLTSIAFTDLLHGNRILALLFVVGSSLLAPLTIPGLLLMLGRGGAAGPGALMLAVAGRAAFIMTVLAIPFVLAQLVRTAAPAWVEARRPWWGPLAVACSLALVLVSFLSNQRLWAGWPAADLLLPIALVSMAGAIILAVIRLSRRYLGHEDGVAFACGLAYLNNGLAVAFVSRFFADDPRMVLPALLMQIPMTASVPLIARILGARAGAVRRDGVAFEEKR